jgi:hypothetical protein
MTDASPDIAEKLFLFYAITIHFALDCPRRNNGALLVDESGFSDWMFLLLGTRTLIRIAETETSGRLAPLLHHGADRWLTMQVSNLNFEPTSCAYQHLDSKRTLIMIRQSDVELREIYIRAIDHLQSRFKCSSIMGASNAT